MNRLSHLFSHGRMFLREQRLIWKVIAGLIMVGLCWPKGWALLAEFWNTKLFTVGAVGPAIVLTAFSEHVIHELKSLKANVQTHIGAIVNGKIAAWPTAMLLAITTVYGWFSLLNLVFG